jgi:hypothetical protein
MKTQIDLLEETEQILLELLAQYKSGQYGPLTRAIACVRILKRSLGGSRSTERNIENVNNRIGNCSDCRLHRFV